MRRQLPSVSAFLLPLVALASCAAPKAVVIQEAPAGPAPAAAQPAVAEPAALSSAPDDGIRLPDMLGLPGDSEFKRPSPAAGSSAGASGAVIARPPVNPPAQP